MSGYPKFDKRGHFLSSLWGPAPKECAGSLFAFNHPSVLILECTAKDDDPINEVPNSQTSQCQNHSDSGPCFPNVEPVSAENAQEPAKQKGGQPVLVTHSDIVFSQWIGGQGTSAFRAKGSLFRHFCATMTTILHNYFDNSCLFCPVPSQRRHYKDSFFRNGKKTLFNLPRNPSVRRFVPFAATI